MGRPAGRAPCVAVGREAIGCCGGGATRCGAWYTGRGPVCGVIMRRIGVDDCGGGVGLGSAAAGGGAALTTGALGGAVATGAGGGAAGRGGDGGATAAGGDATRSAAGGCATGGAAGRGGGAMGTDGLGGAATGAAARGAATGGSSVLRMALKTSPGFEIFDRSILVLISSGAGPLARDLSPLCPLPSPWPLK